MIKIIVEATGRQEGMSGWNATYAFEYEDLEKFHEDFNTAHVQAYILIEEANIRRRKWKDQKPEWDERKSKKDNDEIRREWSAQMPEDGPTKFVFAGKTLEINGDYDIYGLDEWFADKLQERG